MIQVRIDEAAYSSVAKGLVRQVVGSLIEQLVDNGVLSFSQDLDDEGANLVFATAFGVLVKFEDFHGQVSGTQRHPVVVGFMSVPTDQALSMATPEEILISRRRSDLHGGVDDTVIREIFKELQQKHHHSQ